MTLKQLSTGYDFQIIAEDRKRTIRVTQQSTGRVKDFFLAGGQPVENLQQHMYSLTDDQCKSFFKG